jgi:hypothetical protein
MGYFNYWGLGLVVCLITVIIQDVSGKESKRDFQERKEIRALRMGLMTEGVSDII